MHTLTVYNARPSALFSAHKVYTACTLHVHSAPISELTVWTVRTQYNFCVTYSAHISCSVLDTQPLCKYCPLCNSLTQRGAKCASSKFLYHKITAIRNFSAPQCIAGAKNYVHCTFLCRKKCGLQQLYGTGMFRCIHLPRV